MKRMIAVASLATMAACAQGPSSIAPATMPDGAYSTYDCGKLYAERSSVQSVLSSLESTQRGAVAGDAIGVLLIGVPVSSLAGGDKAGEIATEKGKLLAIEAQIQKCGGV